MSLSTARTEARALLEGDRAIASRLAATLIKPLNDNFVERPWAGTRMAQFKGIARPAVQSGFGLGEAFEIAADDADDEARRYPSRVRLADGSEITLPSLLAAHADILLGAKFIQRYGARFPLLPKILDIAELLSVQAHPEGNTEVYVIIEADPGATIRLGFNADIDAEKMKERLSRGRREQQQLLELLWSQIDANTVQRMLQPWLAERDASGAVLEPAIRPLLGPSATWEQVAEILASLHALYWEVLESMNEIPVAAGQVIHNANPPRIAAERGRPVSAEVHALGNPQRREILALEIRRPGSTFRAWDNVRFPLRDIDVGAAIDVLNLRGTQVSDFIVEPKAVSGRPGVTCSVDSEYFRIEHLAPTASLAVDVPAEGPHCLHALHGNVTVHSAAGELLGALARGESALVPLGVGAYRVSADTPNVQLVKVSLPGA